MKAERGGHDPPFKAKVALEALKGVKTIEEIAEASGAERKEIRRRAVPDAFDS